jgi:hypothetical protein
MGWERRERGGLYYRRSVRRGGRVVKEYIGTGLVGELAAAYDERDRDRREMERCALARAREELAEPAEVTAFCEQVEALTRVTLLLAGYRQHDRGEWRRRRGSK